MNNKELHSTAYQLYQLLKAAQGNIYNCMYIDCSNCTHTKSGYCGDFIFSTMHDGSPVLLPVSDISLIHGFSQDKSDYLGVISCLRFCDLFFLFFMENVNSTVGICPVSALFAAQKGYSEKIVKTTQKTQ